jgi:hypothetical protein
MNGQARLSRSIVCLIVTLVVLVVGGCHDFNFYAAMLGLHGYVGSVESMGYVYAIGESEYSQDQYAYVCAIGEMLGDDSSSTWQEHEDAWNAVEEHRLYAVDVSDARNPVPGTYLTLTSPPLQIVLLGDKLALVFTDQITLVDVSDPANPGLGGSYSTTYESRVRTWRNQPVVVSDGDMTVIDTSNVSNPAAYSVTDLSAVVNGGSSTTFAITNGLIAFGREDSVVLASLSEEADQLTNPSPSRLSVISVGAYPSDMVFISETRLAVLHSPGVLTIVDVSNPSTPRVTSRTEWFREMDDRLGFNESRLMVGGQTTLWVLDTRNSIEPPDLQHGYVLPEAPVPFFSFMNHGFALGSGADFNGYLLVPTGNHGLTVYRELW